MRVLVTGGAGFIGSNFLRLLARERPSWELVNFDLLTYAAAPQTLPVLAALPRYRLVQADIADAAAVDAELARGVDAVVHFAAESHVDRSLEGPAAFVRTNILGTQVLLAAALHHRVGRYVQVSTDEVYGSLGPTGFFSEESPLRPSSPYAASKASADLLVGAWHHSFALPALITRCSNNYGPYQHPEKLMPRMILRALADRPLPVFGDGRNIRDWIHVEDHCRGVLAALEHGRPGQVYNFGGSEERENLWVANEILARLQKPASLLSFVPDRLGHDRRYAVDATRARTELGWAAPRSFAEGLSHTVAWYAQNRHWWEGLHPDP
jgi:dTDP-glucose 4,6-dehydratase